MDLTDASSKPLSANQLREFFDHVVEKGWNVLSNKNIPKYIILQSYCSLWGGDLSVMQKYFFRDANNMKELRTLLQDLDLFGPNYGPRSARNKNTETSTSNVNSEANEPEYRESQRGKQCGHVFKKGESVYRCKNCGLDNTCVMCSKCFHSTKHDGHHIKIWISQGGGFCDCGDPEAWKLPLQCEIHSFKSLHQQKSLEPLSSVPQTVIQSMTDTIRVVLNYILETFAAVQEDTSKVGTAESIKKRCRIAHKALGLPVGDPEQEYTCILWNDERHSFDTVIKVLSAALNMDTESSQRIAEIVDEFGRHGFMSDTNLQDLVTRYTPFETVKLEVSITSSQMSQREYIAFYLLSWLKDIISSRCHFFSDVQDGSRVVPDIMCRVLAEDWELSPELAHLAALNRREKMYDDKYGFEEDDADAEDGDEPEWIEVQAEVPEDVDMLDQLSENELETFFDVEGDTGSVDEYHDASQGAPQDLNLTEQGRDSDSFEVNELSSIIPMITNEDRALNGPIRRLSSSSDELCHKDILELNESMEAFIENTERLDKSERKFANSVGLPLDGITSTTASLKEEFQRKTRLDYLLQFDLRLWKSARNYIKDILINTFISNIEYRPTFGLRFSRNYPELIDARLFKEREPDHSITELAVQVLTVPTVATLLVKEVNFFGMVCTILTNYFSANRITLDLPEEEAQVQINCLGKTVRRQSFLHVISHMKFIMNAEPVKEEFSKNPLHLRYFLDFMYKFQEMDLIRRQAGAHVEFEPRGWITAFSLTMQLVKLCELFADSFGSSMTYTASQNLWRAIYSVLKEIIMWKQHPFDDNALRIKGCQEFEFKQVNAYNNVTERVVKYDTTKEAVSLHRPFHWLLSKLLRHVSLLDLLSSNKEKGFKEMIIHAMDCFSLDSVSSQNAFLLVIEPSIRTLATIAQVSCGVWVRNGYGIRNQVRSYKDAYLRESTFDTDIHLLQVGFTVCNDDTVLLTLMDRFQVLEWFQGNCSLRHPCYDHAQYTYMIEEFLNLLVVCASEHSYVSTIPVEQRMRQSIIQHLGLSSMSFSELMKCIPDSLSEHASIEEQLYRVANYKAPDGLTDKGLFELKHEYIDQMDPYFCNYTRNQQEEALHALKKRWNQLHPDQKVHENEEFLFVPKLNYIREGPFTGLSRFLHSRVFCQVLTHSLLNYTQDGKSDNALDLALHLAMIAILDPNNYAEGNSFIGRIDHEKFPFGNNTVSLLDVLLQCLDDHRLFSHAHKRLTFITDTIESKTSEVSVKEKIRQLKEKREANKLASHGKRKNDKTSDYEKKKAAAKARQDAIMSQFVNAQTKFMEQNTDIYDFEEDEEMNEDSNEQQNVTYGSGNDLEVVRKCQFTAETCIVCQEDFDENHLYGMLGCIQISNMQRLTPLDNPEVLQEILSSAAHMKQQAWFDDEDTEAKPPFIGFPQDSHLTGLDISSCGHLMHASCFENFRRSNNNDILEELTAAFTVTSLTKSRFLCPLCKALGNVLVPVVWTGKKETYPGVIAPSTSYNDICNSIKEVAMELKKSFEYDIEYEPDFETHDPYLALREEEKLRHLYNQLMRITHNNMGQLDSSSTIPMNLPLSLKNMYLMYATTISDLEIAQRGNKNINDLTVEHTGTWVDHVPRSSQLLLKILSLTNTLIPNLMNNTWQAEDRFTKERLALQSINQYMPDTVTHLVEDMVEADNLKPLLMEDTFHALVRFSFVLHEMPRVQMHHVLRTMYLAELAKIIVALANSISESVYNSSHVWKNQIIRQLLKSFKPSSSSTVESIQRFARDILVCLKLNDNLIDYFFQTVSSDALVSITRLFVLPFVRKAYLFMVVHHGLIPQRSTTLDSAADELDQLSVMLNLPLFNTVFDLHQGPEKDLLTSWCTHYLEASDIKNTNAYYLDWKKLSLHLPTKYHMVTLPYCMDDLLDESIKRKCTKCNTVPEHSAICLICGTFVCARHFCCIEEYKGECNTHMKRCGGEIGIYIMIKECFLILLHANGGHIMNAPYLDKHGEADLFFKRGARQYLNRKRYGQIRQLWLNQAIPSFVRRKMDNSYNTTLWESF